MKFSIFLCGLATISAFNPTFLLTTTSGNVEQEPDSQETKDDFGLLKQIFEHVKDDDTRFKMILKLMAENEKKHTEESRYLQQKLTNVTADARLKDQKLDDLKCGLSVVKVRIGWEEFEDEFGSDVKVIMFPNETKEYIGYKERNRRIRERKCLLIFEEKSYEEKVKWLKEEIQKHDPGPLGLKKFAYAISWAFQYLCDSVHAFLAEKVRGPPNLHDLTDDKIAYYALQIFVKYKYVELPNQFEECVPENHATKAP